MVDIVSNTGVGLDPVYTLKGVRGLLAEMGKNPGRFAGKRVLFIHTGNYNTGPCPALSSLCTLDMVII